jgi:hypothetical protein
MDAKKSPQNNVPSSPRSGKRLAVLGSLWVLVPRPRFDGCLCRYPNNKDRDTLLGGGGGGGMVPVLLTS